MLAYPQDQLDFLKQLDDLPNGIDLTPEQCAAVLGVDTDWLRKKRQQSEGAGPPFRKLGEGEKADIRYPLGLLRKWQRERVFANTHAARLGVVGNFSEFLASGLPTDTHLFRLDNYGRPTPWQAGDDTPPVALTLEEFCDKLKAAAAAEFFDRERAEIDLPPLPPKPTETL